MKSALRMPNLKTSRRSGGNPGFWRFQNRTLISAAMFVAVCPAIARSTTGDAPPQNAILLDEPSCEACRLVLEPVVKFGAPSGQPGELCPNIISLAVDDSGKYYAAPTCSPGQVNVYTPTGAYSHSISVPKPAAAYIYRLWVSPTGDLHVADRLWHHVFDPDGNWLTAQRSTAAILAMAFLPDGSTVQHFVSRTPELFGLPLHLKSKEGKILTSFGAAEEVIIAENLISQYRVVSGWEDDSILAVPLYEFLIEEWGLDGRLRRSFSIARESARAGRSRPAWTISSMRRAEDGRVWVLSALHPDLPPPSHEQFTRTPEQIDERADTRVDVVDLENGRLWVSDTTKLALLGWINDLSYSLESLDHSDRVAVAVWRVGFSGSEAPKGR